MRQAGDSEEVRSVIAAWGRHQDALFGETSSVFADLDLTMGQFRALVTLRRHGRLSGRELAAKLGVNPATVVPLVDRLVELGYVARASDQEDRRLTWHELTPRGEELFHRLWRSGIGRIADAVRELGPADREAFKRLLGKIADHLEAHALSGAASGASASSPDRARREEPVNSRAHRGGHSSLLPGPSR